MPVWSEDALEAGRRLLTGKVVFTQSLPDARLLPPDGLPELAFAGRSNVGKSSLINALVNQNGLARTSNTPGRTQMLTLFEATPIGAEQPALRLVDMPGYGYADAPRASVAQWGKLVRAYLRGRPNLKRALVLIDARHGAKPNDAEMMAMLDDAAVSYQLVLTKADKLSAADQTAALAAAQAVARQHTAAHPDVLTTSAEKGWGIAEVRAALADLLAA
jgi:GTP-binding protein